MNNDKKKIDGFPHVKDLDMLLTRALNGSEPVKDTIQFAAENPEFGFTEEQLAEYMAKTGRKFYEESTSIFSEGREQLMTASQAINVLLKKDDSGLDGFERMLAFHCIPVRNDLEHGIAAGSLDLFFKTPSATALVPEFISRTLLKYATEDYSLGDIVAELILTPNGTYRQPSIDESGMETGFGRVAEYAKSPVARLKFSEVTKTVGDRTIALQLSYKAKKDVPLNLFMLFLKWVARADAEDLLTRAVEVLESAAGTPIGKTTLDSSLAANDGTLSYKAWLKMTRKENGYKWDRAVGRSEVTDAVMLMQRPSVDPIQISSIYAAMVDEKFKAGVSMSNIRRVPTQLLESEKISANTLVLFDRDYALNHIKEIGVDITEYDKIINGRFEEVVVSKSDDFCVFVSSAVKAYDEI